MRTAALPKEDLETAETHSLIDELNDAVASGGIKQRLRILDRITDLFAVGARGYSSAQIAVFDDVLRELAADIETRARARLAQRVARIDNSPPRLVRQLAFDDEITVAEPVLIHSRQLSDADLIENAKTKSQDHLFAIAQRLKLSEAVTDVLVERGDRRVVNRAVRNRGARFSTNGYVQLTNRARHDYRMTLALSQRGDLPRQYFLKLLETASATVRARLESANPPAAAAIRGAVDDVATDLQQEAREASWQHAVAVRDGRRRANVEPFTEASLHAPAHAQQFERTVFALSELGQFPIDLVERALLDKGEDLILILAKAVDCSWTTTRQLLRMYTAERDLTPDDLARVHKRYQALSQETARKVVNFYKRRMRLRKRPDASRKPAGPLSAESP